MEESEMIAETSVGFFTDAKGRLSMRRLLSFILCMSAIGMAIVDVIKTVEWRLAAINIGFFLLGSLLFMFFTSWESIAKVAKGVRGKE